MFTNTLRIAAATIAVLLLTQAAEAAKYRPTNVTQYCGDRICPYSSPAPTTSASVQERQASRDSYVIGGVPPECRPWYSLSCGCQLSLKIFGRVIHSPNLKQARTWGQVFHHIGARVGAVVGRGHHVAYIQGGGPGAWELWDPNSGGNKTRIRTSNLREFAWIVDPHSSKVASLR